MLQNLSKQIFEFTVQIQFCKSPCMNTFFRRFLKLVTSGISEYTKIFPSFRSTSKNLREDEYSDSMQCSRFYITYFKSTIIQTSEQIEIY